MERSAPVRNPHTSTADLLTWKEAPPEPEAAAAGGSQRPHQVSFVIPVNVDSRPLSSLL